MRQLNIYQKQLVAHCDTNQPKSAKNYLIIFAVCTHLYQKVHLVCGKCEESSYVEVLYKGFCKVEMQDFLWVCISTTMKNRHP